MSTQLNSPFATGGGGYNFESKVQSCFALLMLADGYIPCMHNKIITKLKFQCKAEGYETDDLVVFAKDKIDDNIENRLLIQIKHDVSVRVSNKEFYSTISGFWKDYNNSNSFNKSTDAFVLITGPLDKSAIYDTRQILEWARNAENKDEFFRRINLKGYSSIAKRRKLSVFSDIIKKENGNSSIDDRIFLDFLKHIYLLGYDLDVKAGVMLSLHHSLITDNDANGIWEKIRGVVQGSNQNAGTLTKKDFAQEIINAFAPKIKEKIPTGFAKPKNPTPLTEEFLTLNLIGGFNEKNNEDIKIIRSFISGI